MRKYYRVYVFHLHTWWKRQENEMKWSWKDENIKREARNWLWKDRRRCEREKERAVFNKWWLVNCLFKTNNRKGRWWRSKRRHTPALLALHSVERALHRCRWKLIAFYSYTITPEINRWWIKINVKSNEMKNNKIISTKIACPWARCIL